MRIPRIYIQEPLASGNTVTLDKPASNHVSRVLRMRSGDPLILFNGEGGEYRAIVAQTDRNHTTATLESFSPDNTESPLSIILAQGISRGERMDYTIQKSVELGIHAITPLFTERSVVQLQGERLAKKQQHWQAIAISACEQSGRTRIPQIHVPRKFSDWLHDSILEGPGLVLAPDASQAIGTLPQPAHPVTLLAGPEGGLTQEEISLAQGRGFAGVRIGPRILRTETASLAACAALQTLWGDYR